MYSEFNNLSANTFEEAFDQIPTDNGAKYLGTYKTTNEVINQRFIDAVQENNFFYLNFPEQLTYHTVLKFGAFTFTGYGDCPTNSLLMALYLLKESYRV